MTSIVNVLCIVRDRCVCPGDVTRTKCNVRGDVDQILNETEELPPGVNVGGVIVKDVKVVRDSVESVHDRAQTPQRVISR